MANTFKFGNGNWAVKDGYALAYNDENNNFKPLPFDFTRASSATRVNKQGLIEVVPSGKPRIDFLDNTSGHLLLEPSRTNSLPYSEDFSDSSWTKSNSSVSSNQATSPDGSLNAYKFIENNVNTYHRVANTLTITNGVTYSTSIFVKKSERKYVRFSSAYGSGDALSDFDLENGVVLSGNGDIENYGNGWFRISNTFTADATFTSINAFQLFLLNDNQTRDYLGDGQSGVYIWGAQLEQGSYATSYIPTDATGSSVTRVAERNSQGNLSNVLSSSGVLYTEIELGESTTKTSSGNIRFSLTDNGGTNDWVFFGIENGDNLRIYVRASSSTTTDNTVDGVFPSAGTYKIAFRFDSNNTKVFVNGVQKSSDTSSTPPSNLNFFQQGGTAAGASDIAETLKVIETRLYDTALTDTELQNLTS